MNVDFGRVVAVSRGSDYHSGHPVERDMQVECEWRIINDDPVLQA